jgi:hypothetical protein
VDTLKTDRQTADEEEITLIDRANVIASMTCARLPTHALVLSSDRQAINVLIEQLHCSDYDTIRSSNDDIDNFRPCHVDGASCNAMSQQDINE